MRALGLTFGAVLAASALGCASIPPPRVLADADAVAASPSGLDAKTFAPTAFAAAEKLRGDAHYALEHDRQAHAQILAEQALAAYDEAAAVARTAKAERRLDEAELKRQASEKELGELKAEVDRAQADVAGLELQLKVIKDAAPIAASGPASKEREAARRDAARAMLVQGKFLCMATSLFLPKQGADDLAKDLATANADLEKVEAGIADTAPAPIDLATRTRAACLSLFSRARRAASEAQAGGKSASASAEGDALLGELSAFAARTPGAGGLTPERDERGVVVTVRSAFDGDKVSSAARARLEELDRVVAQHPRFRVAVVVHTDAPLAKGDDARWATRASDVAGILTSVPKDRLATLVAGNFSPVVDPHGQDKAKNARVEIVFIPEAP